MFAKSVSFSPTVSFLSTLSHNRINSKDSLKKVIRRWLILRSLYVEQEVLDEEICLSEWFEPHDWSDRILGISSENQKNKTSEIQIEIEPYYRANQLCQKSVDYWLFDVAGVDREEWKQSWQTFFAQKKRASQKKQNSQKEAALLENLLKVCPFDVTLRTLRNDFNFLYQQGWLEGQIKQENRQSEKREDRYQYKKQPEKKLENFFKEIQVQQRSLNLEGLFNQVEVMTYIETFSNLPTNRFFIYLEQVLNSEAIQNVGHFINQLNELWQKSPIVPIKITYDSASANRIAKDRVVYPMCLFYYQRALYLCVFGETPKKEIDWYNYRLDRIENIEELAEGRKNPAIPNVIKEKYPVLDELHGDEIQNLFEKAYGIDLKRTIKMMLLRFEPDFHDSYIKDTVRHKTFKQINLQEAKRLINSTVNNDRQKQKILEIVDRDLKLEEQNTQRSPEEIEERARA